MTAPSPAKPLITPALLAGLHTPLMGTVTAANAALYAPHLDAAAKRWGISQAALPCFLAMPLHESGALTKVVEDMHYSTAARLDAVANAAIQNAVGNFAGKVAADLAAGTLTKQQAVVRLEGYLMDSVADSFNRLAPSKDTLTTMLLGKVAQIAGVAVPVALPTPTTAAG